MNFYETGICKARLKCSWFRQNMDENLSHRFHRLKKKVPQIILSLKKRHAVRHTIRRSRIQGY